MRRLVALCALCLTVAALGLALHAASRPDLPQVEQVLLRLGPADFGGRAGAHVPVERIGMEAREVIVDRRPVEVARLGPVARTNSETLRIPVTLPESTRSLPDGSFSLLLQSQPNTPADLRRVIQVTRGFFEELSSGWSLVRDPVDGRAAVLRLQATGRPVHRVVLRLDALEPIPARLESRVFDPPARSHVELSWGVRPSPQARGAVSFKATLACAGTAPTVLLERAVSAADQPRARWHDERLAIPDGARACRLVLETSAGIGDTARAVWGVPRFVASRPLAHPIERVVLISLDTLRADHLSSYGYPRNTSPRIDASLVARGTTFTDASTTFPITNHAHASLFTGFFRVAQPADGWIRRDTPVRLLAEAVRDAGFETVAFTEGGLVSGEYGFWFGVDRLRERAMHTAERAYGTFADGLDYLRRHPARRSFLFLHTYKTHAPRVPGLAYRRYFPHRPGRRRPSRIVRSVPLRHRFEVDQYDRLIRETDDVVGRFLDELDALGLADSTLVILLSDHGEAFGEHHMVGHGMAAHQEQLHVPLVFRGPGVPPGLRIAAPVSLVDVAPTVLAMLGLSPLPRGNGIDLRGAFAGVTLPAERALAFEWLGERHGVRLGRWKLFDVRDGLLVDLGRDPEERRPVHDQPAVKERARRALATVRAEATALRAAHEAPGEVSPLGVSEHTARSLRALGYVP